MEARRQEMANPMSASWTPKRSFINPLAFSCGRVGPYRLGPELRCGAFGPVNLAIGQDFDEVLEIEKICVEGFEGASSMCRTTLASQVLDRMNHCVGLTHPHVALILGAGLFEDTPYVLRPHRLSRTLSEVLQDDLKPPPQVAAGILYSVADGLRRLFEHGPHPGACSLGGFDGRGIMVGWDGSVRMVGAGLSILRDERSEADRQSLVSLTQGLDPSLLEPLEASKDWAEILKQLRSHRREACAGRQEAIGSWMRQVDAESCHALRCLFNMDPLQ